MDTANGDHQRPRFTLYDDVEIEQLPPPEWEIDSVIPAQGLAVIFGQRGSLKTFVGLDLAVHKQLGFQSWHGHRIPSAGCVLYVYAEGRFGISARLRAWKALNGWRDRIGISFLTSRVTLNEPRDVAALLAAIEAKFGCNALGTLSLIIVDTLNRNSTGNENAAEDMGAIVRGCDMLRERTGAAVVLIHHTGLSAEDRGRGSSVLDGAVDTAIAVTRDGDRVTLECKKQKDAPEFAPLAFQALSVAGSLALKPIGPRDGGFTPNRMAALRAMIEESNGVGLSFRTWHQASGITAKSSFDHAREWLSAEGYVKNANGKWSITDSGLLALRSNQSNVSPITTLDHNSVNGPMGGGCIYTPPPGPTVGLDRGTEDFAGDPDWRESLLTAGAFDR